MRRFHAASGDGRPPDCSVMRLQPPVTNRWLIVGTILAYAICIQHMPNMNSAAKSVALQRASHRQWVLKSQDLAIALKLVALKGRWLPYADLGEVMHLSRFEAHAAVQRLKAARLVLDIDGLPRPALEPLRSFIIFGAPYAYPPVRGQIARGFPTAHGVSPLKDKLVTSDEMPPVWPHPEGHARGPALLPLYENLPLAARDDPVLYELLALFDGLRIGRARERNMAMKLLDKHLQPEKKAALQPARSNDDTLMIGGSVPVSRKALSALCKRYHIERLTLFGSAARGELTPQSDIDVLVEFKAGKTPSLGGMVEISYALSELFGGRKVDLATPSILNNPYRRRQIEQDMEVLYAA
jgi:predicted nucleotidyltransferase